MVSKFLNMGPNLWDNSMSPVAPCTQVGWGVVNISNVMPIYNHLAGNEQIPSRPADVVACMNANQQIRELLS